MSAVCGLGATRAGSSGTLNKARAKSCGMGMQALLGERHTHNDPGWKRNEECGIYVQQNSKRIDFEKYGQRFPDSWQIVNLVAMNWKRKVLSSEQYSCLPLEALIYYRSRNYPKDKFKWHWIFYKPVICHACNVTTNDLGIMSSFEGNQVDDLPSSQIAVGRKSDWRFVVYSRHKRVEEC